VKVLVGFEFSGVVRDEFIRAGFEAVSCDLLPSESGSGPHFQGDIFDALWMDRWDIIILHPPCTHMAVSGNRWYANTPQRFEAVEWTESVWNEAVGRSKAVALENPVSVFFSHMGGADQYIQPWMFGHPETKKTGLLLHNLPKLKPTHDKPAVIQERVWRMAPHPDRAKERSRFFPGVAKAMVTQWA
jgi:hypothetical protein